MDKEEAIKIVKSHYPANKQMLNEALEYLIPELKEKTDEEVRQQLIAIVNLYYGEGVDAERDKCLEWLEKQVTPQVRTGIEWVNTIDDACDKRYSEEYAEGEYCHEQSFKWGFQEGVDWLEKQVEPEDKGEISDGYHTFNELYYYRMLYNAAFFNSLPKAWVHKSKKHHDGEECFGGGWFIVMANLPTGQISNHYELKDWELFQIPEKEIADEWDGHTPKEAAERLHKYLLEKQGESKSDERKDFISIPFGTDSELIEETITIPDGYCATIEGRKVCIKKK